ncbi:phosphopantetheine-binding protein [Streptomyces sp. NPDC020845]|uniref:phosphopantetheine-binding protein n=1 Tax=Streptomyces sp. NPDC020845 TaxID=3365096 RepID=UPI00379B5B3A
MNSRLVRPGDDVATVVVDVEGTLDLAVLRQAADWLTERHGEPGAAAPVDVVDLRNLPPEERSAAAVDRLLERMWLPYDTATHPLVRLTALQVDEDWFAVLASVHRDRVDTRSLDILTEELWQAYGAFAADAPESLPAAAPAAGSQVGRPARPVHRIRTVSADLPGATAAGIHSMARAADVPCSAVAVAAVAVLLDRVDADAPTDRGREHVVDLVTDERPRPGLDRTVGPFEEALPVRVDLAGDPPFADVLDHIGKTLALGPGGEPPEEGRVTLRWRRELRLPRVPGLALDVLDLGVATSRSPLEFAFTEKESALGLTVGWREDVLGEDAADRMLDALRDVLANAVASPGEPVFRLLPQAGPSRAPSDLEARVAAVWAAELDVDVLDMDTDFFELGGNSFQGAAVIGRLRRELGIDLPLRHIFDQPATVARLAREIERIQRGQ